MALTLSIRSPGARATLAAAARALGWTVAEDDGGAVTMVDLRGGAADVEAFPADRWGLALLADTDPDTQAAVVAAGARQVAVVGMAGEGLEAALALAARSAAPPERRAGVAAVRSRPLAAWIDARAASGEPVTLVSAALRRLDLVNAAHGRDVGTMLVDAAERRIAAQVSAVAEDDGLVVRTAGPTFLAAIAGEAQRAVTAAARIEEALARRFRIDGSERVLGAAIGLLVARTGETGAEVVARAAAAAAEAGSAALPTAGMDALAVDVHRAIGEDAIRILFQPQVAVGRGIVAVEALARWRHPECGELGAEVLLGAAERAGIAVALSDGIVRTVLARVAAWPAALSHLPVSFNLTAADLARPGFVETLLAHIDAAGVDRQRLTVEVTETGLIGDLAAAAGVLGALQAAGLGVAIDDFGAGYSNLAYLAALPVDHLKLDRSLVRGVADDPRSQVVVRGAIDMARSLGLAVIAEGVETAAQADALAAAGCTLLQGFLYAPPLAETELLAMVEAGR